jgi:tetrapyrrole methylase family protein/MazG family protein/ATP diphosphatase
MKSKAMSGTSEGRDDPVARLVATMAALRDQKRGCPWDLAQSFETIAPYTIEEAYEVADAIGRGDMADLRDELGDLLLQVVYHARMAEEAGAFDFAAVAQAICEKMIRRHPHVFAAAERPSLERQGQAWEEIKAGERAAKSASGLLDDIPLALPALTRALKLSSRAARVGFVWRSVNEVVAKLREEVEELDAELARGDRAKAAEELGDVLFNCANIARALDIDPEAALRATNAKFVRRFAFIEAALAANGTSPAQSTLSEMDRLWNLAKQAERAD